MKEYEINCNTLAIIPIELNKSIIYEINNKFEVYLNSFEIIQRSCNYFGCNYSGRKEGTKTLIGVTHKPPIIIEESKQIIFFPTSSPRLKSCCWINLNNLKNYYKSLNYTVIEFYCGKKIKFNKSFGTIDNQVLRSCRLKQVINDRINAI